jgi:uncharacterized protein
MATKEVRGEVAVGDGSFSTIELVPKDALATLVLAHGAGAGMEHPLLEGFARAIAEARVATYRFNFLYVERAKKAPDREPLLREAWLATFADASSRAGDHPVLAGGKSLGGRIASMCVADGMPAAALVFLGYPLHAPGKPGSARAAHLERIHVPMLFVQGTRDALADLGELEPVVERLGDRATLERIDGGDHSFKVPGPKVDPAQVGAALAGVVSPFVRRIARGER